MDASLTYQDVISKSVLLSSGSPVRYQLVLDKETAGCFRTMTFGKKDSSKINKTILLVGETAAGKSSLVNALVNYAIGMKFEDDIWFQIVEEEKRSQSESQTSDVMVYQIFGFEGKTLPYSLTIIDTPGFGDTRGIDHDDIINQSILDFFCSENGTKEIHAVGLVLKASECRLHDRIRDIFNSVMSLFGKAMVENIVALITHSNGRTPRNVLQALEASGIRCARNKLNQPVHFLFDNCQNEERTEDIEHLRHADKVTMKGMKQFTDFLEQTDPQELQTTEPVLKDSLQSAACSINMDDQIKIDEKQSEAKQGEEVPRKFGDETNKEKVSTEVELDSVGKQRIDGGMCCFLFCERAVTCSVCKENCHYPGCTMAWCPAHCEVMKNGHCTKCTGKCSASEHVKENWIYVNETDDLEVGCLEDCDEEMQNQKDETKLLGETHNECKHDSLNSDTLETHHVLTAAIEKLTGQQDT